MVIESDTDKSYILNVLKKFVAHCNYYKGSYFWTPFRKADDRRKSEEKAEFEEVEFEYMNNNYKISASATVSCKNFYFDKVIKRNGEKTTMTVIKNLIKKLEK